LRRSAVRGILALRGVELLFVAMLPTLVTTNRLYDPRFPLTDIAAVVMMSTLVGGLSAFVWLERAEEPRPQDLRTSDAHLSPQPTV
jgi:hypothetical protein